MAWFRVVAEKVVKLIRFWMYSKVQPAELQKKSNEGYERKQKIESDSKGFGLSNSKIYLLVS